MEKILIGLGLLLLAGGVGLWMRQAEGPKPTEADRKGAAGEIIVSYVPAAAETPTFALYEAPQLELLQDAVLRKMNMPTNWAAAPANATKYLQQTWDWARTRPEAERAFYWQWCIFYLRQLALNERDKQAPTSSPEAQREAWREAVQKLAGELPAPPAWRAWERVPPTKE